MKLKRLFRKSYYSVWNFLKYKIWGDYKHGGICGFYEFVYGLNSQIIKFLFKDISFVGNIEKMTGKIK